MFKDRLREQMSLQKRTAKDIAELVGKSKESISKWRSGERTPNPDEVAQLAKILRVNSDYLLGLTPQIVRKIPVTGCASCGNPQPSVCDLDEMVDYPELDWKPELFAIRAYGESMSPEINDGDRCIIDPTAQIVDGDLVYYKLNGETAIKIFWRDDDAGIIQFVPYNQTEVFKTKTVRIDETEELTIYKVADVVTSKKNGRAARLKLIGRG